MTEAPALFPSGEGDGGVRAEGAAESESTASSLRTAPAQGAAAAKDTWGGRARAALVEGRELTHAGVSGLSDDDLVALGEAIGAVRKDADRMMAVVAAVQAARSRAKSGVGLARRRGKGDERSMVSAQTGGSEAEAGRLIELGETLRDAEQARDGEVELPKGAPSEPPGGGESAAGEARPVFVVVADAVSAGRLSTEAASMITRMLKRVAPRCSADAVEAAEKDLVFSAQYMRVKRLAGLITRTEQRLDAEHLEELARQRRERRFVRIGETAEGMITINGRLDPDNGAPLVAAMEAMVGQHLRLRKRMRDAAKAGEAVVVDERTTEQVRADAIGDFARHITGCDVDVLPQAGVTLVVRVGLDQLRHGVAGAQIDGLATGLDAGSVRRMAAAAGVIPQVMDGESVVLDQGRAKRGFTYAQKLALVERDGGCAMCGAPPSWCDAHHIVHWAHGGPTDMDNGVLLCVRCHQDIHIGGWDIHATAHEVWFTPPPEVDPHQRPRPGARRLFDTYPLEPEQSRSTEARLGQQAHADEHASHSQSCALAAPDACVVGTVEPGPECDEAPMLDSCSEPRGPMRIGARERHVFQHRRSRALAPPECCVACRSHDGHRTGAGSAHTVWSPRPRRRTRGGVAP